MKAKSLETLLASESGLYSEMVTRFQAMRNFSRLPKSRGKHADILSTQEIVYGILSVVADKPGFAPTTAIGLYGMYPVGLPEDAFAGALTLGNALVELLENEDLRKSLIEVRLGDSDPRSRMSTTAAIVFGRDGEIVQSQYIDKTALSLFHKGKEREFDRRSMGEFSISRETVIAPRFFNRLAQKIQEVRRYEALMSTHSGA